MEKGKEMKKMNLSESKVFDFYSLRRSAPRQNPLRKCRESS